MTKRNVFTHGIALIAILFFGVLALGSTASAPKIARETSEKTVVSSVTTSYGVVHNMQDPNNNYNMEYASLKPYSAMGMVFATSTTNFDENGLEFASQESILIMLLREAHKLGADDILNLRLSENTTWVETTVTTENNASSSSSGGTSAKETKIMTKTVTITGSALAIKYQN